METILQLKMKPCFMGRFQQLKILLPLILTTDISPQIRLKHIIYSSDFHELVFENAVPELPH